MKKSCVASAIVLLILLCGRSYRAQQSQGGAQNAQPHADTPTDPIIDRIIARENELTKAFANYSPLVETYIQNLQPDSTVTKAPKSDKYFLGKLDFSKGVNGRTLMPSPGFGSAFKNAFTQIYSIRYLADGFAQLILVDGKSFDREHYDFVAQGREFLGDVRCLVFDV